VIRIGITIPDGITGTRHYTWMLGEKPPPEHIRKPALDANITIEAGGGEADSILARIHGVPYVSSEDKTPLMIWRGDFGRFILENYWGAIPD
jgi:hypothetical protein